MSAVLFDKQLIIVTGKGGVGKSSVAAALALLSAGAGRRTLLVEVNAPDRASALLELPPFGDDVALVGKNLWAVNLRPEQAMREYGLMILKFERLYRAVFENRVVRHFMRFVPSLAELTLLGKLLFHMRETLPSGERRFEQIVVDAPATGHALTFLSVPEVILNTVPPGALAESATWMRALLVDPSRTAPVLVSLPEDMPINETLELAAALKSRVSMRPQAVVLNAAVPSRFDPGELQGLVHAPALHDSARVHEVWAAQSADAAKRLATLELPLVTVPRLHLPNYGRAAIESLAGHLRPLVERPR